MPTSKWWPAALALLAWPGTAPAQVYKCVAGGIASYQSEPCGLGKETARVWQPADYAPPSADELARIAAVERATARRDAELRAAIRRANASRSGSPAPSSIGACEAAKAKRDRELDAMGKAGRKVAVRRAADAKVALVCR